MAQRDSATSMAGSLERRLHAHFMPLTSLWGVVLCLNVDYTFFLKLLLYKLLHLSNMSFELYNTEELIQLYCSLLFLTWLALCVCVRMLRVGTSNVSFRSADAFTTAIQCLFDNFGPAEFAPYFRRRWSDRSLFNQTRFGILEGF